MRGTYRLAMHSYPELLIFRVEMVRPAAKHFGAFWVHRLSYCCATMGQFAGAAPWVVRLLDCYAFTPSTTPSILDAGYHVCRYFQPAPSNSPAYSSSVRSRPVTPIII